MRKLRKMLGDITDPSVVSLMRLIETQSKATLSGWAVDYAEKHYLGIYQKAYADERRLQDAVSGVREYLDGSRKTEGLKAASASCRAGGTGGRGQSPRTGCCPGGSDSLQNGPVPCQCTGVCFLWGSGVCLREGRTGREPGGV